MKIISVSFITRVIQRRTSMVLILVLTALSQGMAQPIILSVTPPNGASGIAPTSTVVFTFSAAMNPAATFAQFLDVTATPPASVPVTFMWGFENTTLTCRPMEAFPANKLINWLVVGQTLGGEPLGGNTFGFFTTGDSGGGECTNEFGALTLAKGARYLQSSSAPPTLDPDLPFIFVASSALACSNATTTNIVLTTPEGTLTNLSSFITGHYSFTDFAVNATALEDAYPDGDYVFTLQSSSGAWSVPMTFPAALAMPNAPQITNYDAAQSIDPAQPFVLGWNEFQSGTDADYIRVEVFGGVIQTPPPTTAGALPGTARSIIIPAHSLAPATAYAGDITFYDLIVETNAPGGYLTLAYRAATTEFTLRTSSGLPDVLITSVNRVGTNLLLTWEGGAPPFVVMKAEALSTNTNWEVVTSVIGISNAIRPIDTPAGFYRISPILPPSASE